MKYFKKRYYRVLESVIKKILKVKKTKNKNLQKTIRSAIFNSNIEKNQFLYSDNEDTKYLMHSYDWISKKLFIDQGFDDTVLKKAVKILKIKKFKNTLVNVGAHIGSTCIPALKKNILKI